MVVVILKFMKGNIITGSSTAFAVTLVAPAVVRVTITPSPEPFSVNPAEECLGTVILLLEEKYPLVYDAIVDFTSVGEITSERQTMVKMYCALAQLVQVGRIALVGTGAGLESALQFLFRAGKSPENTRLFVTAQEAESWLLI